MEELWKGVGTFLLQQGWAGILVIFMALALWDQRKEITFLRERNAGLQDARVKDALSMTREMVEGLTTARGAVQTLSDLVRERR